jgi:hypothetical protein
MAKAGMEKLHAHSEEHLSGGVYDDPTPAMVNAANTIGEDVSVYVVLQNKKAIKLINLNTEYFYNR